MTNNDFLRRLRYALNIKDNVMVQIFKKGNVVLTREDVMNSQYYWLQNGDEIYLNTRGRNLNGFGKEPVQTISTAVSLITSALTVYLLFSRL